MEVQLAVRREAWRHGASGLLPLVQTQAGPEQGTAFYFCQNYLLTAAHNLKSLSEAAKHSGYGAVVQAKSEQSEGPIRLVLISYHPEPYLDCALLFDEKGCGGEVDVAIRDIGDVAGQLVTARGYVGAAIEERTAHVNGRRAEPGSPYFQALLRDVAIKPGMSGAPVVTISEGALVGHVVKRDRENYSEAWVVPVENLRGLPHIGGLLRERERSAATRPKLALAHFLDHYVWELNCYYSPRAKMADAARNGLLALLLLADVVYVPAVSYFEHKPCREIVDSFSFLFEEGRILLAGDGEDLREFSEMRLSEYPRTSMQTRLYQRAPRKAVRPDFHGVHSSTTAELLRTWPGNFNSAVLESRRSTLRQRLRDDWPRRLDNLSDELRGKALIAGNLTKVLFESYDRNVELAVMETINRVFFDCFVASLTAHYLDQVPYLGRGGPQMPDLRLDYRAISPHLSRCGVFAAWKREPTHACFLSLNSFKGETL